MNLFYEPDIETNGGFLNETDSRHCIKVLRFSQGKIIDIVDGKGHFFKAEITLPHPKKCQIAIIEKNSVPTADFEVHIAIAPTKNMDRLEWFTEKATEIGITSITPILCENSERKNLKLERIEKKAISAMKQSLKSHLPQINPLIKFGEFCESAAYPVKLIAHCEEEKKHKIKDVYPKNGKVLILIGPEGDFSPKEITLAKTKGFQPVSLGESRLRTETAGLVACHTIHLLNEN